MELGKRSLISSILGTYFSENPEATRTVIPDKQTILDTKGLSTPMDALKSSKASFPASGGSIKSAGSPVSRTIRKIIIERAKRLVGLSNAPNYVSLHKAVNIIGRLVRSA
ncbi:MAG: hypothetical protein CM1200mP27_05640 [Chloroflexota bacterium]|nr:MAG: hypothetical protein CM1200mP27_05640 [Chloroflexota bacterium]